MKRGRERAFPALGIFPRHPARAVGERMVYRKAREEIFRGGLTLSSSRAAGVAVLYIYIYPCTAASRKTIRARERREEVVRGARTRATIERNFKIAFLIHLVKPRREKDFRTEASRTSGN